MQGQCAVLARASQAHVRRVGAHDRCNSHEAHALSEDGAVGQVPLEDRERRRHALLVGLAGGAVAARDGRLALVVLRKQCIHAAVGVPGCGCMGCKHAQSTLL